MKILSEGQRSEQPHKFLRMLHGLSRKKERTAIKAPEEAVSPNYGSRLLGILSGFRDRLPAVPSFFSRRALPGNPGGPAKFSQVSSRAARSAGRFSWRALLANERFLVRTRTAIIYLLILFLSHSAARLTWALLISPAVPAPEPVVAVETKKSGIRDRAPVDRSKAELGGKLASLHLFGESSPLGPEIEPSAVTDAPATTLSLVLRGLIAATPEDKALAIISEKSRDAKEKVYAIGEEVPGNAVIQGILVDRVILLRAGKLEVLFLEIEEENRSREPQRLKNVAGGQRISRGYVEGKLANLPDLAREVGVQIHTRNGKQYGYQLVSAQGSEFLNNLGLEAGDILYEVNGIRLSDASSALTAYEQLKDAKDIQLVFERNGTRQTKTFSIQ